MNISKTSLVDKRKQPPEIVEADLCSDITAADLFQTEVSWGPIRLAAMERLFQQGYPPEKLPQHYHWNWTRKSGRLKLLAYRCLGIQCEGEMQGLMMVNLGEHFAQVDPDRGKPILYVDYSESAPWNIIPFVEHPRFGAIGVRLFDTAVKLSLREGFAGRVALHALPQAEEFYAVTCGMTMGDPDVFHEGLRYFEFTQKQAQDHLKRGSTR